MCGIVGYIGPRSVIPVLVGGLEKLEYRGYDSAGIAVIENGDFYISRVEGKLKGLRDQLSTEGRFNLETDKENNIGIGHTRWATHGRPSETNAHPHTAGRICVVHNGIIENYAKLRKDLQAEGCKFISETDTEIAAHLINKNLGDSNDLYKAVKTTIKQLEGSYALLVSLKDDPDTLILAKDSSPAVIGLSEDEVFVASDIPAVLQYTKNYLILEDGDIAKITKDEIHLENSGKKIEREPVKVNWDPITAEKGGYKHFMLKEIHEQPNAVTETFRGRIKPQEGEIILDGITDKDLLDFERIVIVACGTAWHAGLVTKFYIERLTKIPVEVDYASEFRYRTPIVNDRTLFICVSQSGETADTLGSLDLAKKQGAKTLAICNAVGSTISRRVDNIIYTHAGPEISVASTKAFSTQLTAALLLALKLADLRKTITKKELSKHLEDLMLLPSLISSALETDKQVEKIAKKYGKTEHLLYLGRGLLYPIALEGALKLKEISYIHAEGYPSGEMKHGPIALIDDELPVVVLFGKDGQNYEKTMSNLIEVESRGGRIIAVTDKAVPELKDLAWETIELGEMSPLLMPIVFSVPLQLLSYHAAIYLGTDVDQPRNLAKSVTVE